ncbi:SDR family NAD(P)-dependent oxidoreductase [Cereibacter sp. SYSU M97828]|nr:SDR family NAD(P)-dependent oxidoreductase [Cereibacter flavus]
MGFCVITGAASGIGLDLARIAAADGHELLLVDRDPALDGVAANLGAGSVLADLATRGGVDALCERLGARVPDILMLNAGRSLGHAFGQQPEDEILDVIETNVTGTTILARRIAPAMAARGSGRILFTGSIVGYMPGPFQAVYNASKAYVNSLSVALSHELSGSGVTVTCLMPGVTDTRVFERAGMLDTPVGQMKKDDPADVARTGYDALMAGREQVTHGVMNKVQATAAEVLPAGMVAELHRRIAEPK